MSPSSPTSTQRLDSKGIFSLAGLIAGPALAGLMLVILPDQYRSVDGTVIEFSAAGRATLAMMVWMAVWWLTEAIHVSATALLPLAVFPLLGVLPMDAAAAPYASPFIFLFMGGFILALSMQRWGLDRRIALITLRLVGIKPANMVGGFMLATAMISAFVSNTATAAMMLPIGLSVLELLKDHKAGNGNTLGAEAPAAGRNFAVCLMLGIAYASSIGGVTTIIGTPPNLLLVGFIRDEIDPLYRREISFLQWMMISVPLVAVLLPATWLLLTRVLYPIKLAHIEGGRAFLRTSYQALGRPKGGEWATFFVFIVAALAWIIRPWLSDFDVAPGPDPLRPLAGLSDAGIAIIAALVLFVIPVNVSRHRVEFVMNWETARKLPWGVLILFGGGLSLAAAIETNGVAEMIGAHAEKLGYISPLLIVILIVAAVVFFSELASNTATAATAIPILASLAPGLGMHPFLLIIPAGIAASCAFMMPVGTPPNAIVFGTGYITIAQMCKAGFWLNLISIILITLLAFVLIPRM